MGEALAHNPIEKASCPRCGYDQRGVVESWTESCPMSGVCAECGLEFVWGELMRPKAHRPAWCVEFTPTKRGMLRAVGHTVEMAVRPWRFWTELKMIHAVRLRRLVMMWIVMILALYLLFAGVQAIRCAKGSLPNTGSLWGSLRASVTTFMVPFSETKLNLNLVNPSFSDHMVIPRGVTMTFLGDMPTAYQLQNSLMLTVSLPILTAFRFGEFDFGFFNVLLLWGVALLMPVITPFGFLALPETRNNAQVRWQHIFRIAAYSFIAPAVLLCYALIHSALIWLEWFSFSDWNLFYAIFLRLCFLVLPLWLLWWWTTAVRHYLKMPHALGIGVCIVLMAYLLGPIGVLALTFLEY